MPNENYINHVALVLDESISMHPHAQSLVAVADGHVQYLAKRSQQLDQETRVSVYTFSDTVRCLIYDKDVLRLPSIASLYRPRGNTALLDATLKALDDLEKTPELYGDHAFLTFVLTDGQENSSRVRGLQVAERLRTLRANWTVGVLVPDQRGVFDAKGFGFPADNIAVWDTQNAAGVVEAGETIRRATDSFMEARSLGVRGTRSLFSTGLDAVNAQSVQGSLTPLRPSEFTLIPVSWTGPIKEYVESRGLAPYQPGKAYYQLTKPEMIQSHKAVVVVEKGTGRAYGGPQARRILGLPDGLNVRVRPQENPQYDVYVQSTSLNRKLLAGTNVLVLR